MTESQFHELDGFAAYAEKQFALPLLAGCFVNSRVDPAIATRAVGLSLLLGEVVHVPSLLQLEEETKLPQWQRWVGYSGRISHDTFGYASHRMNPEQLRRAARFIIRKLKRGKALEASKMPGMLVVSLDADGQLCSDHRCCEDCLSREVTYKDAQGHAVKKTPYYHKQVYAPLSGPRFSDTYPDPVRGVRVRESWTERTQQGKEWKTVAKEQTWIGVVAGDLDGYDGAAIRDFGHRRWKKRCS